MATQRTARTIAGPASDLGDLADPIDRIAVMFTELGTELGVLGEQLRGPAAQRATASGETTTNTEGDTVITGERTAPTGGILAAPPDRPTPGGSRRARPGAPDRIPLPTATIRTGTAPIPGEPVDTSFAEPTQTPAAHAAGAAPSSGAGRGEPGESDSCGTSGDPGSSGGTVPSRDFEPSRDFGTPREPDPALGSGASQEPGSPRDPDPSPGSGAAREPRSPSEPRSPGEPRSSRDFAPSRALGPSHDSGTPSDPGSHDGSSTVEPGAARNSAGPATSQPPAGPAAHFVPPQPDGLLTWLNRPVGGGYPQHPAPVPPPHHPAPLHPASHPLPGTAPPPPPRPTPLDRMANWTARQGTRLLAWAGAAITLLGVVLLMVMAVQHGWIGPVGRTAGGAALGAVLLGCAFQVRRRSTAAAGAFALAATGIAVLYLDVLAATALYEFLPAPAGLAAALVLALLGLWLADRWRSQALAAGVVLGCALCAPLLFGPVPAEPATTALLTGFLVVLKVAAMPVQVRRSWRGLTAASAVPAVLAAVVADGHALLAGDPWPATAAALAVTCAGVALAVVTARHRPRDPLAIALLVAAGAPTLLVAPLLDRWSALGVLVLVAAAQGAVWAGGLASAVPRVLGTVAGGMAALTAFQATLLVAGGSGRSLGLLAEAVLLALLAHRLRGRGLLLGAALFGTAGTLLALVAEVPPTSFLLFPAGPFAAGSTSAVLSGVVAFLLIGAAAASTTWSAVRLGVLAASPRAVLPAALGVLYGGSGAVLALSLLVVPGPAGFLAGHALITVSWLATALLALLRGIRSVSARVTGFVLVGAALAKLLLFDLAALSGLVRVLAFLAAGLLLLAGGTRYARLVGEREERATA